MMTKPNKILQHHKSTDGTSSSIYGLIFSRSEISGWYLFPIGCVRAQSTAACWWRITRLRYLTDTYNTAARLQYALTKHCQGHGSAGLCLRSPSR